MKQITKIRFSWTKKRANETNYSQMFAVFLIDPQGNKESKVKFPGNIRKIYYHILLKGATTMLIIIDGVILEQMNINQIQTV